ncbi:MAG: ABC transporter permease [Caulobacterales bacterium]
MSAIVQEGVAPGRGQVGLGLALLGVFAVLALIGPALAPHDPEHVVLADRLAPPLSPGYLLGTDHLGRDLLSRLLTGLRWSFLVAGTATLIAFALGVALGLFAAVDRGPLGVLIRQIAALTQSLPVFVLAVAIIAVLGNGFTAVALTLGLVTWPMFARVVDAEARSILKRDYIAAAAMMQMGRLRLLVRHVLPGLLSSLSVLVAFHFADMLIAESALSFLGVGAALGQSTWGVMLSDSRAYLLTAPWLLLAPALAVVAIVISFNLVGDGLRRLYGHAP